MIVVDQHEGNWQRACRLINFLLREGAEVRWARQRAKGVLRSAVDSIVRGLADFADLTRRIHNALERAEALLSDGNLTHDPRKQLLQEMVRAFEDALHYQTPAEPQQDFGYEGILQMLERATEVRLSKSCRDKEN